MDGWEAPLAPAWLLCFLLQLCGCPGCATAQVPLLWWHLWAHFPDFSREQVAGLDCCIFLKLLPLKKCCLAGQPVCWPYSIVCASLHPFYLLFVSFSHLNAPFLQATKACLQQGDPAELAGWGLPSLACERAGAQAHHYSCSLPGLPYSCPGGLPVQIFSLAVMADLLLSEVLLKDAALPRYCSRLADTKNVIFQSSRQLLLVFPS